MKVRFGSTLPLQIKVQTSAGQLVDVEQMPPQNNQVTNTEVFANAVRPQLQELSMKTPYPAADITRTPFPALQDDAFSLSGMLDTDTVETKHGTKAMLLTGPDAVRNIGKAYMQQFLASQTKQMPLPIQHQLIRQAVGHNCYHGVLHSTSHPALMVVIANPNTEQARQKPWLIASLSHTPPPEQISPAVPTLNLTA